MNILIVDDSAPVRRMIHSVVQPFSVEIFECEDGATAIDCYARHHPDWVLMDVEMAKMDGIAATKIIHDNDPQARICIVTNYDDEGLREAAREAGATAFLVKDDLHTLRRVLTEQ